MICPRREGLDRAVPIAFIELARASLPPARSADDLLNEALESALEHRERYVSTLARLSFPQAFWHTEALDDLREVISGVLTDLGVSKLVPLPELVAELMPQLPVEVQTGPEDYESGEGSEAWGRLEQISRIMGAVNHALPPDAPKRFYRFREDLPGWECDEPIWLYLTARQVEQLRALSILRPWSSPVSRR